MATKTNKVHLSNLQDWILFFLVFVLILPSFQWIKKAFLELYDPFNLIPFFLIIGLIVYKLSETNWRLPKFRYSFHPVPFVGMVLSFILWYYFSYLLKIHIFSTTFGFTFIFGLLGLYIDTKIWTKSIVPVGLLIMTLPFGNLIDIYIGFPLRIWTVGILASFFHDLGWNSVTSDTIITIDNTASQIDFSCSGLKGLWAGLVFYFAISWLENLKIGWKWLTGLALLASLILMANILRITTIITLTAHFQLDKIAQTIHAPLGIIGFTFSCGITLLFIKSSFFRKAKIKKSIYKKLFPPRRSDFGWTKNLLIILCISSFFIPKNNSSISAKQIQFSFPTEWHIAPLHLTKEETQFFKNQGSIAKKMTFTTDKISGSLLLVNSPNWKGHHNPEHCIRASGHQIDHLETIRISDNFPIKWLGVNEDATACFWFQSPTQITDDFSTRIWSELRQSQNDWILVSIVFNSNDKPLSNPATTHFLKQLKQLIHQHLNQ